MLPNTSLQTYIPSTAQGLLHKQNKKQTPWPLSAIELLSDRQFADEI
jgi:hypothetical protein